MKSTRHAPLLTWSLIAAALPATLLAGPLQREHVAADAKWVLHLDLDNFRSTQVGDCIVKGRLDRDMAKAKADLKTYLDFDFDWTQINGLTAYGMDYQTQGKAQGVLLVQSTLDVQKALESAITKQAQAGIDGNVKVIQDSAVPLYCVRDEFFVALPAGKPVVLSKTRDLIQKALAVLAGQAPNLAAGSTFAGFPPTPKAFAFLGMAAGFTESAPIPPQARVLKMTDAARLVLGETGNQVFLTATLQAKTPELSAQMQQVLQGLIALGALGQPDNQDLQQLIQATKVSANDRLVTVDLQFPVATVVQKIQQRQAEAGR